ncbi:MAG TPA: hypothetical protein VFA30_01390 [Gaiellaceae bacterium]|nr:hypothetical protein [Gaiellaceae bacterium]
MRRIAVLLVLVGALAASGTALAATGHGSNARRPSLAGLTANVRGVGGIQLAARYLGTTPSALLAQLRAGKSLAQVANATPGKSASGLVDAIVAAETARLTSFAKTGKLSQAAAAAIQAKLRPVVTAAVNATTEASTTPVVPVTLGAVFAPVAAYLDIPVAQLLVQLKTGKSLGQIADATPGKSSAGLVAALVADAKARLGSWAPANLEQLISQLVNGGYLAKPTAQPPMRQPPA